MRTQTIATIVLLVNAAIASAEGGRADEHFANWPEGKSPKEIGDRVAKRFIESPHQNFGRPGRPERISYPEVCTWWGGLTFAKVSNNDELKAALVKRFDPLLAPVKMPDHPHANARGMLDERDLVPVPDHVDHTVFAAVPLELYVQTKEEKYLKLGQMMADWQWTGDPEYKFPFPHPIFQKYFPDRTTPKSRQWIEKGYTWQTRLWIDDMFMITMAQAQAYRATGDRKYIDRAAKEMVLYLDELQKENGLFHHAPGVPYFWGRGDGWMAAGTAELLRSLPHDNPDRPRIMKGYHLMMASLLKHQDDKGMWHQLIDDPASWPETSCTGMFTFAFITGVKHGWLDEKTYGPAARKGWLALTTYLEPNGDVREVCQGTNIYDPKNPEHGPDGRAYYLARQRNIGDMHGQAPMLWCATALLRAPDAKAPTGGG
jgi:rhamnogalacturonyl hydrolase YesR